MPTRLGPALASTDEQLQEDARITPDDVPLVLAWLRLYAPELEALLQALPVERDYLPLPFMAGLLAGGNRYLWLTQRGLYFNLRTRRAVDPELVRRAFDRALDRAALDARQWTMRLSPPAASAAPSPAPRMSLAEWEVGMRQRVKQSQMAARMTATGGVRRTHIEAMTRMQESVVRQATYLRAFAQQIESGAQPVDGRALSRAALYPRSARPEHFRARGEVALSVGYDQARTVLTPGDNCKTSKDRPGCVEEAERGWVAISEVVMPGERTCVGNCRCVLQHRNSQTGEVYGATPDDSVRIVA